MKSKGFHRSLFPLNSSKNIPKGYSDYLILLVRLIVGGVFIYASVGKIAYPQTFSEAIGNYKILPYYLVHILAILIPWLELISGAFLALGLLLPGSILLISGLLTVFLLAMGSALIRGLDISCGCFHTLEFGKIGFTSLLRNLILLILTGYILAFQKARWTLDHTLWASNFNLSQNSPETHKSSCLSPLIRGRAKD